MRTILALLTCIPICGCNTTSLRRDAPAHRQASAPQDIPMGILGYPVGTAIEIEGVREREHGKFASQILVVDTLNGQKLATPIKVWIHNAKRPGLPTKTRCVLRGYETGLMVGTPPALLRENQINTNPFDWQLQRRFVITSIVEPESLEIE